MATLTPLPFPDSAGTITSTIYYGGLLYVAGYSDTSGFVYQYAKNTWFPVGNRILNAQIYSMIIDASGNVYVGGTSAGSPFVYTYATNVKVNINTSWSDTDILGIIPNNTDTPYTGSVKTLVRDLSGNIYAGVASDTQYGLSYVLKYNGAWSDTQLPNELPLEALTVRSSGEVVCAQPYAGSITVTLYDGSWNEICSDYGNNATLTTDSSDNVIFEYGDYYNVAYIKAYISDSWNDIVDISNITVSAMIPGPNAAVFIGGADSSGIPIVYKLYNGVVTQVPIQTPNGFTIKTMAFDTASTLYVAGTNGVVCSVNPFITDRTSFLEYIDTLIYSTTINVPPSQLGLSTASGDVTTPIQLLVAVIVGTKVSSPVATVTNPQPGDCLYVKCSPGDTFTLVINGEHSGSASITSNANKSITINGSTIPFGSDFTITADDGYLINLTNYVNGSVGVTLNGYSAPNTKPAVLDSNEIKFIASSGASFAAAVVGAIVVGVCSNKRKYSDKSIDISTGIGSSLIGAGVAASALLLTKGLLDRKKRLD